jgi:hypothetical protein
MSKEKKQGRVKLGSLPREEKKLGGAQATRIKGAAGNGGVNGGDCRSGALVRSETNAPR